MSERQRAGRWRTGQQSKQRIVHAARERFMREGYRRATVRAIAADAGVDWDEGTAFEPMVALWDTAPLLPQAREMLHSSLVGPLGKRIQEQFDVTDAELRLELVASHLIGLAFARYQLKIEPLASADADRLAASIGATIDRYLTDPATLT
jgi:hypothetical protein